jgi:hypothetical protein
MLRCEKLALDIGIKIGRIGKIFVKASGQFGQRALHLAGLAALFVAGCADIDPAYDPTEWARSARSRIGTVFGGEPSPAPVRVEPPPAEGRPYPNLASVPPRPPRISPRVRDSGVTDLSRERDQAIARDAALRAGGDDPGPIEEAAETPKRATQYVGLIVLDRRDGGFSIGDMRILDYAAATALENESEILLQGASDAMDRVRARLEELGVLRERIIMTQAARRAGGQRAVEILMASAQPRR